jgi:hypothetical protein
VDVCTEGLCILDIHIPFLLKFHSGFVLLLCVRKKTRKATIRFITSDHLSVRMKQLSPQGTDFRRFLIKCMEKIQFV